jgi:arylsulfatase
VRAPQGAPSIVLILIDDAGFGQFSTFGGMVPSPTMDRLAAEGLRYNRFHTTALCSPTRVHPAFPTVVAGVPEPFEFDPGLLP